MLLLVKRAFVVSFSIWCRFLAFAITVVYSFAITGLLTLSGDAKSLRKSRSLKVRPSEPITLPANGDLDATTPDSQADSGIGPATTVSKQLLEAIKLSSTSPPRDDLDDHNVLQPLREVPFPSVTRIRKRSHSFPLMSAAHQVDNCDSAKRYSLCRDSSMDTDCSGNRTLTSAQGFIDDEIGDFSSFVGNYVSLSSSREEMLEDIKREPTEAVKEVNPERCKASGAGLYYGQVNTKNTFEVISQHKHCRLVLNDLEL